MNNTPANFIQTDKSYMPNYDVHLNYENAVVAVLMSGLDNLSLKNQASFINFLNTYLNVTPTRRADQSKCLTDISLYEFDSNDAFIFLTYALDKDWFLSANTDKLIDMVKMATEQYALIKNPSPNVMRYYSHLNRIVNHRYQQIQQRYQKLFNICHGLNIIDGNIEIVNTSTENALLLQQLINLKHTEITLHQKLLSHVKSVMSQAKTTANHLIKFKNNHHTSLMIDYTVNEFNITELAESILSEHASDALQNLFYVPAEQFNFSANDIQSALTKEISFLQYYQQWNNNIITTQFPTSHYFHQFNSTHHSLYEVIIDKTLSDDDKIILIHELSQTVNYQGKPNLINKKDSERYRIQCPLETAVASGNVRLVKALVDSGADVHTKTDYQQSLIHFTNDIDCLNYLIEQGLSIDDSDYYGRRLVHCIAMSSYQEKNPVFKPRTSRFIKNVLSRSQFINGMTSYYLTPIQLAAQIIDNGDLDYRRIVIELLIKFSANINVNSSENTDSLSKNRHKHDLSPLMILLTSLLESPMIKIKNPTSIETTQKIDFSLVEQTVMVLLEHGVDLNEFDTNGQSPLHLCLKDVRFFPIAKQLLAYGADANAQSSTSDKSPIDTFAKIFHYSSQCIDMLRCLFDYGAKFDLHLSRNLTPYYQQYLTTRCLNIFCLGNVWKSLDANLTLMIINSLFIDKNLATKTFSLVKTGRKLQQDMPIKPTLQFFTEQQRFCQRLSESLRTEYLYHLSDKRHQDDESQTAYDRECGLICSL